MKSYLSSCADSGSGSETVSKCEPGTEKVERVTRKRMAANSRERKRMQGLNTAFDRLRKVVPQWGQDKKLSKYETLQMALSYIMALNNILTDTERYGSSSQREWLNQQIEHFQQENNSCLQNGSSAELKEYTERYFSYQPERFQIAN
ncbi:ATOH7 protein, partial [Polyodon spathula]|nr:protein atonal homolog 7-like [Polyodon spathula]MBN3271155.1 ATOH7 protein [Polyodon spathula]